MERQHVTTVHISITEHTFRQRLLEIIHGIAPRQKMNSARNERREQKIEVQACLLSHICKPNVKLMYLLRLLILESYSLLCSKMKVTDTMSVQTFRSRYLVRMVVCLILAVK